MTYLALRNTTPEDHRKLPSRFHTYTVIKDRSERVAEIIHAYRPKNAGGSAWQAKINDKSNPMGFVTVYSKDLKRLCEIIRFKVTGEGDPPHHWR